MYVKYTVWESYPLYESMYMSHDATTPTTPFPAPHDATTTTWPEIQGHHHHHQVHNTTMTPPTFGELMQHLDNRSADHERLHNLSDHF